MTHTVRPPTVPTPVTTPSAGVSGSWLRAKAKSSWNSIPGSSRSFSRARTKSLPSSLSLSRYLTCPCSMRARSWKYRSSLTLVTPCSDARRLPAGSLRWIRIRPEDDDQHAVAVRWTAKDGGGARCRDDARVHLGAVALEQTHPHPHPPAEHLVRRDFEPSLARDREPLGCAQRPVHTMALERRVVVVSEDPLQLREDPLEPLVVPGGDRGVGRWQRERKRLLLTSLGRRRASVRLTLWRGRRRRGGRALLNARCRWRLRWWHVRRLQNSHAEPDHLLRVGRRRGACDEHYAQPEQEREHRPQEGLRPLPCVVKP